MANKLATGSVQEKATDERLPDPFGVSAIRPMTFQADGFLERHWFFQSAAGSGRTG